MTRTRVGLKAMLACGMCCALLAGCNGGDKIRYGIQPEPGAGWNDAYCGATDEGPKWIRFGGYVRRRSTSNDGRFLVAAAKIPRSRWPSGARDVYDIVVIDTRAVKEVARWRARRPSPLTDGAKVHAVEQNSDIDSLYAMCVSDDGCLVALLYVVDVRPGDCGIELSLWDTVTHRPIQRQRLALGEARENVLRRYGDKYLVRARMSFSTDRRYITAQMHWGRGMMKGILPSEYPPREQDPPSLAVTYPLTDK